MPHKLSALLKEISACQICAASLPLGPRPVLTAGVSARVLVIGQAPGRRVHLSGVPWDDPSGVLLRAWMQVTPEQFYDPGQVAIVPMGFCYPGKGNGGDLPPRKECAPLWHAQLLAAMPEIRCVLLIGSYAQNYYLGKNRKPTLTATVATHADYLPRFFPLPHPSPRNRYWHTRNPWFATDVLPVLRQSVAAALAD